jgi:hypothetical protein
MNSALRFEPDTRVRWHPEQIAAEVDGQVVVMGMSQGKYVGLDAIATNVWHRLERTPTVSELCDGLAQEFEGDPVVIGQDVVELLTRLHALGLIEIEAGGRST